MSGEGSQSAQQTPDLNEQLSLAFRDLEQGHAAPNVQQYAAREVASLQSEKAAAITYQAELLQKISDLESLNNALLEDAATVKQAALRRSRPTTPLNIVTDDDAMETDNLVSDLLGVPKKKSDLLPHTKSMKTCVRNLLSKLARLRARLVKITSCDTPAKIKKHYQFRFISEDSSELKIYEENRKAADDQVARIVKEVLIKDINEQINATKDAIGKSTPQLEKELGDLRDRALAAPDLEVNEQERIRAEWDDTIRFNTRWFNSELAKMKTNVVPKVPPKPQNLKVVSNDTRKLLTLNPKKRKAAEPSKATPPKKPKPATKTGGTNQKNRRNNRGQGRVNKPAPRRPQQQKGSKKGPQRRRPGRNQAAGQKNQKRPGQKPGRRPPPKSKK